MRSHRIAAGLWALVGVSPFVAWPAHAATFSIYPHRLELEARHRTDIITLKNLGEAPLRVQVRTMLWTTADDGQWQLTPSTDLIVTPELIEIAPEQEAQVRVGTLIESGASEGSYRLLLDELPNLDGAGGSASEIRVLTQVSLPVFIEPAKRARVPLLVAAHVDRDGLAVGFGDAGTQRLDPQNVQVAVLDGDGRVLERRDAAANYVLPGRTWFLNVKLPAGECDRAATVSVTWPDLAKTSLTHAIITDAKACDRTGLP